MEAMCTSRVQLAGCVRPVGRSGATRRPVTLTTPKPARVNRRAGLRAHRAVVDSAEAADLDSDVAAEQEARAMALQLAAIADETRAADIRVLGVTKSVHWARYFVLATAFNRPQMQAVANKMRDHVNEHYGTQLSKSSANSQQQGDWVCLDAGDIVAHVFTPTSRQFYDIETLYKGATDVELPFETERPMDQLDDGEDEFEVIFDDGLADSPFADGNLD